MANEYYKPGSFWRIDDRTGFKIRAERTEQEWTNRIVRDLSWEPRQPQDFVRGTADQQTVPAPRPEGIDVNIMPALGSYFYVQQDIFNRDAIAVNPQGSNNPSPVVFQVYSSNQTVAAARFPGNNMASS